MRKQEIYAVIGSLFGDEGKGHTVQWLCKEAKSRGKNPIVVRFSGGSQAGHTVSNGKVTHICSSYGSGVLEGVDTIVYDSAGSCGIFNHAYFDPIAAVNEHNKLAEQYKEVYPGKEPIIPKIYVSVPCRIITPYDMFNDRADDNLLSDGTCGSGQWGAHKRYQTESSGKWFVPSPRQYIVRTRRYYEVIEDKEAEDCFVNAFNESVFSFVSHSMLEKKINEYDVVILEGSQGLLLDADNGFYPHVTSTNVGVQATFDFIHNILKAEPNQCEYYFVTRTYLTRHGNGYEPLPFRDEIVEKHFRQENTESNKTNSYQGVFKIGKYDTSLLHEAFSRNTLDNLQKKHKLKFNLVITHFDKVQANKWWYEANADRTLGEMPLCDLKSIFRKITNSTGVLIDKLFTASSPYSDLELRLEFS